MNFNPRKVYQYLLKYGRKAGLFFSFGATTYKAFDYRARFLAEVKTNDVLEDALNNERDENDELTAIYNNILLDISMDNYNINDIKLPMWFLVYDADILDFRMVKFNKAYEKMYGKKPSEYFAKTTQSVAGDIGEEWAANNRETLRSEGVKFFYERYINKEGEQGIGRFAKWIVIKNERTYLYGIQIEF